MPETSLPVEHLFTFTAIAALADQALVFAAMTVVPGDQVFRTINLNVNFIRVGRVHPLEIEAVVVAQTRRLLTLRATLRREDRS
jgi:acyl-coenzyme A thioesterase PaaI-like protein